MPHPTPPPPPSPAHHARAGEGLFRKEAKKGIILHIHPRFPSLLHKRQAWHNGVSVPLCTRGNCPSVCHALPAWNPGTDHLCHTFSSFPFQMSPEQTQVLSPMVLLKPEHHSWGQHLPHAHMTHPGSLCHQPPSSLLKDPPKSPTPSHSAPEKSQDNGEHDGHVLQVRGGVSMKEGPEALVGGPPLSPSVVPALSAFRLRLPGRDTTPPSGGHAIFSLCPLVSLTPHLPNKHLSAAVLPT